MNLDKGSCEGTDRTRGEATHSTGVRGVGHLSDNPIFKLLEIVFPMTLLVRIVDTQAGSILSTLALTPSPG